ncbi:MAG: GNAT family N-acetyltransferase [Chloroflexota bacterium]
MPIRSLNLPQDFPIALEIIRNAFRYPDHPEWESTPEQEQNYIDQIRSLSRLWPLFRVVNFFSPEAMDNFRGYIWDEGSQPVGVVTGGCGGVDRWEIGFLAVLPEYRKRGIAKQLLQSMLDYIKQRNGKTVTLSVVSGNLPAFQFYERLGFVPYLTEKAFCYPISSPLQTTDFSFLARYKLEPLRHFNYKPLYELDRQIIPASVTQYQPVELDSYQTPLLQELFFSLMDKLAGVLAKDIFVCINQDAVAWGSSRARTRPGGINSISIRANPSHPEIAGYLIPYLLNSVQKNSPGREIHLTLADWQEQETEAALALGFEDIGRQYLSMGLKF